MDLITKFNDTLIDYIAVYPHGKTPVLNPWLKYFSIQDIRIMFIDMFKQDLINHLYSINNAKIHEFFCVIFNGQTEHYPEPKKFSAYIPPHKRTSSPIN
jgi:hypothetical protein